MTIWEISEKADYIAERHRRLQDQWRIYCNSLVQGITLSKARLHHAMSCAPDKDLCFVLFEHFTIYVTLADGFNSHTIEYYVETNDGDDKQLLDTEIEQKTQVKGDSTSLSIAAASLVAKLARDTMMDEYSKIYPGYGFETNSGYGTPKHIKAIEELGITPIHRLSFKPLKNNEDKHKWNYGM